MLLVQYGYIFLVLIFLLLFSSPKGSENKETKISELGKYISYCTLSRAITITYLLIFYIKKCDAGKVGKYFLSSTAFSRFSCCVFPIFLKKRLARESMNYQANKNNSTNQKTLSKIQNIEIVIFSHVDTGLYRFHFIFVITFSS